MKMSLVLGSVPNCQLGFGLPVKTPNSKAGKQIDARWVEDVAVNVEEKDEKKWGN